MYQSTQKLLDFIKKHELENYCYQDSGLVDTLEWWIEDEDLDYFLIYEYCLEDCSSSFYLCKDHEDDNEITEEEVIEIRKKLINKQEL